MPFGYCVYTRWKLGGNGCSNTGSAVTQAQFQAVLANVTRLQIDADWNNGSDNSRLDNVVLSAAPKPESYALMAVGLGLVGMPPDMRRAGARPDPAP